MRMIYADEAGTSDHEPFRVVAGVIIKSDREWRDCVAEIDGVIKKHVPPEIAAGFIFHGTEVFSGSKRVDRRRWAFDARIAFFQEFVSIPRRLGLATAVGASAAGSHGLSALQQPGVTQGQWDHLMTFASMLESADRTIRKFGNAGEVAFVVCENVPERARLIRLSLTVLQSSNFRYTADGLREGHDGHPENFRAVAEHISDSVMFSAKSDAKILQLADACAFVIRRSLCKLSRSSELLTAFCGQAQLGPEWANPSSNLTFLAKPLPDWGKPVRLLPQRWKLEN